MSNFGINLTDPGAASIETATMIGTDVKLSEYHALVALASLDAWPESAARRRAQYRDYRARVCRRARADVVGIFPNEKAIRRPVGALLMEENDECAI